MKSIIVSLLFVTLIADKTIANSLYEANHSVMELNVNNFIENVYNEKRITLVNFYLNWCPHCIKFSRIWKQLADDVRDWKRVVTIGAIDCALDINSDFCQTFQIIRFPRIRLFELNARSDDSGIHFEVRESMAEMRTEIIDYILKIHQKFPFDLNIFPINIASKNELLNALPIDLQNLNLIFLEKNPTHLTVQVFEHIIEVTIDSLIHWIRFSDNFRFFVRQKASELH